MIFFARIKDISGFFFDNLGLCTGFPIPQKPPSCLPTELRKKEPFLPEFRIFPDFFLELGRSLQDSPLEVKKISQGLVPEFLDKECG